ncbi:MAG: hypothetical protein HYX27_17640 [Acidobacteria bacterium]|nr:hypothetical protein [Acidobacteriota bacterium]
MNRRDLLAAGLLVQGGAVRGAVVPKLPQAKVDALDKAVDTNIDRQILDKSHKYHGSFAGDDGLFYGGTPASLIDSFLTALILPQSRHYKSARVAGRLELAAQAFGRVQTKDGNWNLPFTNFNSPPDTSFIMQGISVTLMNAREYGFPDLEKWLLPAVQKAGDALVRGGIHTPNHRWVASSALSGLYKLYGEEKYLRRADQWLAEGIDQDADGQYTERSTIGYNGIVNRALVLIADWLDRPEYLEPVRKNLNTSLYLLHADGEAVTEISRRQDLNQRGTLFNHWPPLSYLAWKDRNGVYASLARQFEPVYGSASYILRWPQYLFDLPDSKPLPDNFEKLFPVTGLARIRRGPKSISVLSGRDRFFTYRHGAVVVNAVRFSTAFFGKGQFRGKTLTKKESGYEMTQDLDAGYYQPFTPPRKVTTETYDNTREQRQRTEISRLHCQVTVTETATGCQLRIQANGTSEVPIAIEINLRERTTITGAEKLGKFKDIWLLKEGYAEISSGPDRVKIGPGIGQHTYLEVRGAQPRLEGPSLYLSGFTPFDHTIEFAPVPVLN